MELEGRKVLVDMQKSGHRCCVPTAFLCFAVLNVYQGFSGPNMVVFGPNCSF